MGFHTRGDLFKMVMKTLVKCNLALVLRTRAKLHFNTRFHYHFKQVTPRVKNPFRSHKPQSNTTLQWSAYVSDQILHTHVVS